MVSNKPNQTQQSPNTFIIAMRPNFRLRRAGIIMTEGKKWEEL